MLFERADEWSGETGRGESGSGCEVPVARQRACGVTSRALTERVRGLDMGGVSLDLRPSLLPCFFSVHGRGGIASENG